MTGVAAECGRSSLLSRPGPTGQQFHGAANDGGHGTRAAGLPTEPTAPCALHAALPFPTVAPPTATPAHAAPAVWHGTYRYTCSLHMHNSCVCAQVTCTQITCSQTTCCAQVICTQVACTHAQVHLCTRGLCTCASVYLWVHRMTYCVMPGRYGLCDTE